MLKIAIYGKGGIGKSTTTSALSAAMAEKGLRVMQIGCDPKADSTSLLLNGQGYPTVLDVMRQNETDIALEDLVHQGYGGVFTVEAGGPTPGVGCAGRGIITAFEKLEELEAYDICQPDVVLYDVLGDVVCGGFAMPLRKQYADVVYVVTSGEKMSLFAARNIAKALEGFRDRHYARLGGLILNCRDVPNERQNVEEAAEEMGTHILAELPRSETVQQAEALGQTVLEAFPTSDMAERYRALAVTILEENGHGER